MIASVIVDISNSNVDRIFDYTAIEGAVPGMRVSVPFGPRSVEGYVVGLKETTDVDPQKLKTVKECLDDFPAIIPEMMDLMRVLREKYRHRIVDILRLFIPSQMRQGRVKALNVGFAELNPLVDADALVRPTAAAQVELLEYMRTVSSVRTAHLNKQFSPSAVKALQKKGVLNITEQRLLRTPYKNISTAEGNVRVSLKPAQQAAVNSVMSGGVRTTLLHGVTGSGKTEVYIHCVLDVIKEGKTAIILVPEISLTPQVLRIFRERFGEKVAILHSGLSVGERFDEWTRLRSGEARIAVGARSAIFAPMSDLGLIVIDEEHDSSYISESSPRYFTQEIAAFRAKVNRCPLVLGSATPSVESYHLAKSGAYTLIELPDRINERRMPEIKLVDMCREIRMGNTSFLSGELEKGLETCLKKGTQAILFLNRRGYASFQQCRSCGYVVKCDDCDVSMVYHRDEDKLKCHYCAARKEPLSVCPECGSESIKQGAYGTERIASELKKTFPGIRVLRMDNDTTQTKDAHERILTEFLERKADVLVGTQMVAKGHDFPSVTLVGIIEADLSLYISDFRAVERTYQLITQVSGRAGRAELEGSVVLQTYSPRHYVFKFARENNYIGFYDKEINIREVTKYPPFSRIVRVLVQGEDEAAAIENLRLINEDIKAIKEKYASAFVYMKAMKCPVKRIQAKCRVQILMRVAGPDTDTVTTEVCTVLDAHRQKDLIACVEINPQNLS